MSASALVTIFCDAEHCGGWEDAGIAPTAAEARRNLKGSGWTLNVPDPEYPRHRLDFCPRHPLTPTQEGTA